MLRWTAGSCAGLPWFGAPCGATAAPPAFCLRFSCACALSWAAAGSAGAALPAEEAEGVLLLLHAASPAASTRPARTTAPRRPREVDGLRKVNRVREVKAVKVVMRVRRGADPVRFRQTGRWSITIGWRSGHGS